MKAVKRNPVTEHRQGLSFHRDSPAVSQRRDPVQEEAYAG